MKNIIDMVGNTPLIELKNIQKKYHLTCSLYAKVEGFNPTGSVKDRAVKFMLLEKWKNQQLSAGDTIVEASSGNTGISLAALGRSLGFQIIVTMPENMSIERRKIMESYGARVILTPAEEGMAGAVLLAEELAAKNISYHLLGQFKNEDNPKAHYITTGPEIVQELPEIDCFVAGIGTGGTISGVAQYLKEYHSKIEIIGVEPNRSPFLTKGIRGVHGIEGIGAGFIPRTLSMELINKVMTVTDEEAIKMAQVLIKEEGLFVGISSGAALMIAIKMAQQNTFNNIVFICPDSADRYYTTKLFKV